MLSQLLISAVLIAAPVKHEDRLPNIPKQEAIIDIEQSRKLTRRERRDYKRGKQK